jgi:hypothetical protein
MEYIFVQNIKIVILLKQNLIYSNQLQEYVLAL